MADGHATDSDSRNVVVAADVFMIEIFMSVCQECVVKANSL